MSNDPSDELGVAPLRGFRPDVQALRGLAVLVVVLYHAQIVLPGGFVGVDVFFVISGFVIGRLLLGEFATTGTMSFVRFYVRRARRLLPALAVMLALVVLMAPWLAPIGADGTTGTGIAAALFSANLYLWRATAEGYFAADAELNPLLHTWSLSVEEQFYFAVPALLLLAWHLGRRWATPLLAARLFVAAVVAVSFAACVAFTFQSDLASAGSLRFAFFSPVTRAWEFAAGLALVVLPVRWVWRSEWVRRAALVAGLVLLGVATVMFSDATRFPGVAALVPVVGTVLVIHAGTSVTPMSVKTATATRRALAPMVWLGDRSYSWYLWHWPLIVFAGALWPQSGRLPLVVAAVVSLVPAWLSYGILEQRLRAEPTANRRRTLALAGVCIATPLLAAGLSVPITATATERSEVAAFDAALAAHVDHEFGCDRPVPLNRRAGDECTWGDPDAATSVVLLGDSMAGQFSGALVGATEARDGTRAEIVTLSACPPVDVVLVDEERLVPGERCRDFVVGTVEALEADPPDVVVMAGATDFYVDDDRWGLVDPATGMEAEPEEKASVYRAGLTRVVERLDAAGVRVVVLNVIPKYEDWDPGHCSPLAIVVDLDRCLPEPFAPAQSERLTMADAIEVQAAAAGGAEVWNFNDRICPDGSCAAWRDGVLVWRDKDHISTEMSEALAAAVAKRLVPAEPTTPAS